MNYLRNGNLAIESDAELAEMRAKSVEVGCTPTLNGYDIRSIEFEHDGKQWFLSFADKKFLLYPLECCEMEQVLTWRLKSRPKVPLEELHPELSAQMTPPEF